MKSGLSRLRHAAHPGIVIDAAQVHQVEQAGAILGEHVADGPAVVLGIDPLGAQPGGEALGHVLLKEEIVLDAVRVALERKRPVLQVRQNQVGHVVVVIQHVALGVAFVGIKDLFQVGEFQGVRPDPYGGLLASSMASTADLRRIVRRTIGRVGRHLLLHARRRLVVPQAQENRRAQAVVVRPLGEFHLADQLRLHPRHAA